MGGGMQNFPGWGVTGVWEVGLVPPSKSAPGQDLRQEMTCSYSNKYIIEALCDPPLPLFDSWWSRQGLSIYVHIQYNTSIVPSVFRVPSSVTNFASTSTVLRKSIMDGF